MEISTRHMKSEEDEEDGEEEGGEISTYVKSKKLDNRINDLPEDLDILRELSECSVNLNNIEGLTSLDVDGFGEDFDNSQVNSGGQDIVDLEYSSSSCDDNFTQWEQQEEGELDDAGA